jgi:hypothetical protein
MPVRFEYEAEQKLLLITFSGALLDADLVRVYQQSRDFAAEHVIARGILDGLRLTSFNVSSELVRSIAHQPPMLPEDSDRCIVVSQDYLYGMARMYQLMGGESRDRLRVVRTLDEAYQYLGIAPPTNLQAIEE